MLETSRGDYVLSPAYDIVNTRLHVDDTDFALDNGLFEDDYKSVDYKKSLHPSKIDFIEFGKRIGVMESRIEKLLTPFLEKQKMIEELTNRSFLHPSSKRAYLLLYNTKMNYLKGSK